MFSTPCVCRFFTEETTKLQNETRKHMKAIMFLCKSVKHCKTMVFPSFSYGFCPVLLFFFCLRSFPPFVPLRQLLRGAEIVFAWNSGHSMDVDVDVGCFSFKLFVIHWFLIFDLICWFHCLQILFLVCFFIFV